MTVHSYAWGPTKSAFMEGKQCFVTFVDDFSRGTWVYVMKSKSRVFNVFLKWKNMAKAQIGKKIKHLRTYNGGQFCNDQFLKLCQDEGIVRHFTVRDPPQQNGVAEHMNRTFLEKVRCMLSNAGLGKEFLAEVVTYACHLINRLPLTAIDDKITLEVWSRQLVSHYDSLHVFGSTAHYHVKESKLNPRAKKAIFLGFSSESKGYHLFCPS